MNVKKILFLFLVLSCVLVSCTKKELKQTESFEEKPLWEPVDYRIGIVFASGYNEKSYIDEILQIFGMHYGLDEENGLIKPMIYPDDFVVAGTKKTQIKFLADFVSEGNFKQLIILGNPERTHEALAKIKENQPFISVISLFSQDSILGTQYGSDLVIDLDSSSNTMETEQHQQSLSAFDLFSLLSSFINDYKVLEQIKGDNKKIGMYVKNVLQEKWLISSYQDPETEIKAQNHFILKSNN